MADRKFCVKCGEHLQPWFQFCPACGADTQNTGKAPEVDEDYIVLIDGKITPISPDSRRLLQEFDSQFHALESRLSQRRTIGTILSAGLDNKTKMYLVGCSAAIFILLCIGLVFMMDFLRNFLERTYQF